MTGTVLGTGPVRSLPDPPATLRVGIVGAGRIGSLHADLLAREVPGAGVSAVFDPLSDRAEDLAARVGARRARSADELIASDAVDAVAICASTDSHVRLIELAAGAGKLVFCEKPLSLDLADIDRLEALTDADGVPLQVGFNRRFDPSHRSVWRAVREGAIGDPHLIRITSRDPEPPPIEYARVSGGLFLDMTSHDFDMARFIAGSEVTEVFARGAARVDPAIAELGDVDTAVSALSHENGCMTLIDNSRRASYGYDQRVEVFGSEGMARSDNHPLHSGEVLTGSGRAEPVLRPFFLDRYRESYRLGWESFAVAAAGRGCVAVGAEDARRALMIGIAATESMRSGAAVEVETAR